MPPKILHQLAQRFRTKWFIDLGGANSTVLLVSSGRSGSTWLADLLNYDHAYRLIFEPFHPHQVPDSKLLKWGQYVPLDAPESIVTQIIRRAMDGRLRCQWSDRFNRRVVCDQRLVKSIRAHMMLGWLRRQFPTMPFVYLIRHPAAVAISMMALKSWEWNETGYLDQSELLEGPLAPFADFLRTEMPTFDRMIANWCAEQYVALGALDCEHCHLVFYEDVCLQPRETLGAAFDFLGRPMTDEVFCVFGKPSAVTRPESAVHQGGPLTGKWREKITAEQRASMESILTRFGLHNLYDAEGLPKHGEAEKLLASTGVVS